MMRTLVLATTARALFALALLTAIEPSVAFAFGARILFRGDSITAGNRGVSGSTVFDPGQRWPEDTLQADSASITSSAKVSIGTALRLRGPGLAIAGLKARWVQPARGRR